MTQSDDLWVEGRGDDLISRSPHRRPRRAANRSRTLVVTNARLLAELGIDRYAKYRALKRLAAAGIITISHHNKRALRITFH
jgi:CRP-like cAMP-binding protein